MTYATTFSGIGGWELGLNACGWELKWQCEANPNKRSFLRDKFKKPVFKFVEHLARCCPPPPVDVWACSPPCQPFSIGGEQKGESDDRHLWPALFAAIQRHRPRYVLIEQVANIDGIFLDKMLSDLATDGYEVLPPLEIPACAVGAWHERLRVWIIAYDARVRPQRHLLEEGAIWRPQEQHRGLSGVALPDGWKPTSAWFEREPSLGRLVHGIPHQSHRLSGLGDAVVPQIPFLIGQAINEIEALNP